MRSEAGYRAFQDVASSRDKHRHEDMVAESSGVFAWEKHCSPSWTIIEPTQRLGTAWDPHPCSPGCSPSPRRGRHPIEHVQVGTWRGTLSPLSVGRALTDLRGGSSKVCGCDGAASCFLFRAWYLGTYLPDNDCRCDGPF